MFNKKDEPEPLEGMAESDIIKEPKRESRIKRGENVLCLLMYPGNRKHELKTLLRNEDTIFDRYGDRQFILSTGPALQVINKKKVLDCYILDAVKGCSVDFQINHDSEMVEMFTDSALVCNLLDKSFIKQCVSLKPDFKQTMGMAAFFGMLAFFFGLTF